MPFTMQKQSARRLVLSPNSQAAYGGVLADAALTIAQRFDMSSGFMVETKRISDKAATGKGTEFATLDEISGFETKGTIKTEPGADAQFLGWALAFLFGQETVVGAGPYTHTFTVPPIVATMPCTTVYVQETSDVVRKFPDMAATSLSIDVPERGALGASLDMVGTGRRVPGAMAVPPALVPAIMLLGSDFLCTITPLIAGGVAVPFSGRQKSLSLKFDRGASAYEASGDGLYANSVACGDMKFSIDVTIAANSTDECNGWFEDQVPLSISLTTNPVNKYQVGFNFPLVHAKASKVTNTESKVGWALSFDETTCLQSGATPALSAFIINDTPAYLLPA